MSDDGSTRRVRFGMMAATRGLGRSASRRSIDSRTRRDANDTARHDAAAVAPSLSRLRWLSRVGAVHERPARRRTAREKRRAGSPRPTLSHAVLPRATHTLHHRRAPSTSQSRRARDDSTRLGRVSLLSPHSPFPPLAPPLVSRVRRGAVATTTLSSAKFSPSRWSVQRESFQLYVRIFSERAPEPTCDLRADEIESLRSWSAASCSRVASILSASILFLSCRSAAAVDVVASRVWGAVAEARRKRVCGVAEARRAERRREADERGEEEGKERRRWEEPDGGGRGGGDVPRDGSEEDDPAREWLVREPERTPRETTGRGAAASARRLLRDAAGAPLGRGGVRGVAMGTSGGRERR